MYDDIRPLLDEEIPQALATLAASPLFPPLAHFIYPDQNPAAVARRLTAVKTVHQLQFSFMKDAIERILALSTTSLTSHSTSQSLNTKESLFISNHRDITLDAFLLNYLLSTSVSQEQAVPMQITFGANLMQDPLITLIGRANRMFRVERGGTPKEFYRNMLLTSSYIRHVITSLHQSVWIAQRNGRTKDGLDRTEPSLLKMLALSGRASSKAPLEPLKALHIVPIAVSYEWEPCDLLKARELHLRSLGPYRKQKGEDINSVLTGILQPKGHVNIAVTEPLSDEEIDLCADSDTPFENLAALIDRRIYANFYLHPNNYIARDLLLNNLPQHIDHYTPEQKEAFLAHIAPVTDPHERSLLLRIYANPLQDTPTQE